MCPASVFAKPQLPMSSFNCVLRKIPYIVHDYSALVTLEALSRFPFQPQFVEDVVSEDSGIPPMVELVEGTTGGILFFFCFFNSSLL